MNSRDKVAGAIVAIALVSSGVLYLRNDSLSSSSKLSSSAADGRSLALGAGVDNDADTVAPGFDSVSHGASMRNDAPAPDASVRMTIGSSPPNFEHKQQGREAAFIAESLDPDWRHQMFQELSASLSVIEEGVASAQIDCKSVTCRVELVSSDAETREERMGRLKTWFQEIRGLGFTRVDTGFSPDGTTSLSYLSTKPLSVPSQLPKEFPPEVAESFRQALRDNEQQLITGPEGNSVPKTWVGGTPDRAGE